MWNGASREERRRQVKKFEDVKVMETLGLLEDQQMIQWQWSPELRLEEVRVGGARWSRSDKAESDHVWPQGWLLKFNGHALWRLSLLWLRHKKLAPSFHGSHKANEFGIMFLYRIKLYFKRVLQVCLKICVSLSLEKMSLRGPYSG